MAEQQPSTLSIASVADFITTYIAIPKRQATVIAAWVAAAWTIDVWNKFPHLCINSPEKRCGKTTLLGLLKLIVPCPVSTSNISPAVMYRLIESKRPTLLLDEAQSISRQGSEQAIVLKEILNSSIEKSAVIYRCGGDRNEDVIEFHIYSPKIFALIGEPDEVLADRSLIIGLRRKTAKDKVKRYIEPIVEKQGALLSKQLEKWSKDKTVRKELSRIYGQGKVYDIKNDRMAALLRPLAAVTSALESDDGFLLSYANSIDDRDREQERQSPGVLLLVACRQIFGEGDFVATADLLNQLHARDEEPWHRISAGRPMTRELLASMLRKYKIRPIARQTTLGKKRYNIRGYLSRSFKDAWARYSCEG